MKKGGKIGKLLDAEKEGPEEEVTAALESY